MTDVSGIPAFGISAPINPNGWMVNNPPMGNLTATQVNQSMGVGPGTNNQQIDLAPWARAQNDAVYNRAVEFAMLNSSTGASQPAGTFSPGSGRSSFSGVGLGGNPSGTVTRGPDLPNLSYDPFVASYAERNKDVADAARSGGGDFGQFIQNHANAFGGTEGRQAFDAIKYLNDPRNADVKASGMGGWEHYDNFGRNENREAAWGNIFNPETYRSLNPDVARAGVDPTAHWMTFGRNENRQGGGIVNPLNQAAGGGFDQFDPNIYNPSGGGINNASRNRMAATIAANNSPAPPPVVPPPQQPPPRDVWQQGTTPTQGEPGWVDLPQSWYNQDGTPLAKQLYDPLPPGGGFSGNQSLGGTWDPFFGGNSQSGG